jgi:hypothetical protein
MTPISWSVSVWSLRRDSLSHGQPRDHHRSLYRAAEEEETRQRRGRQHHLLQMGNAGKHWYIITLHSKSTPYLPKTTPELSGLIPSPGSIPSIGPCWRTSSEPRSRRTARSARPSSTSGPTSAFSPSTWPAMTAPWRGRRSFEERTRSSRLIWRRLSGTPAAITSTSCPSSSCPCSASQGGRLRRAR